MLCRAVLAWPGLAASSQLSATVCLCIVRACRNVTSSKSMLLLSLALHFGPMHSLTCKCTEQGDRMLAGA